LTASYTQAHRLTEQAFQQLAEKIVQTLITLSHPDDGSGDKQASMSFLTALFFMVR